MMYSIAKILLVAGVALLLLSGVVYLFARSGIAFGRLPGDIRLQGGGMTCVIALGTSLLLSVALTIILNIVIRLLNR